MTIGLLASKFLLNHGAASAGSKGEGQMKYLKRLGIAAIAATAVMALASPGTASATTITCTPGVHCAVGTKVHLESVAHWIVDSPIGKIECKHTIEGKVVSAGSSGPPTQPGSIKVEKTIFFPCTTATVHTLASGSLSIASVGGGKASVTSTGAEWTVETFGAHCVYGTNNTTLGTLTGGNPASLAVSANIPRTGGKSGVFCGSTAPMTGAAEATAPKPIIID